MTITAQTSKSGPYNGNGSTTVFSYTFKVLDEEHLIVTLLAADKITETVKVLGTDYTVTGVDNPNGGQITMVVPPAAGEELVITRAVPLEQEIDLQNRRAVNPETLEEGLDRLTQIAQDQQQQLDRSIKVDLYEDADLDQLVRNINKLAPLDQELITTAGIAGEIVTVAGIDADVTTVADIADDVSAVAAIDTKVVIAADNVIDITNFADVYYGPSATNPTTRKDGAPLQTGDLYYNTVEDEFRVYSTGGGWQQFQTQGVARTFYVSMTGDDTNSGTSTGAPLATINAALTKAAVGGAPNIVIVHPGEYEVQPDTEIPANCALYGYDLRVTKLNLPAGQEENNMFLMNSGIKVRGFTFSGLQHDEYDFDPATNSFAPPTKGWAFVFKPGALITRSPYIADCSQLHAFTQEQMTLPIDRAAGNPDMPRGGGNILADGSVIDPDSPLRSVVVDSFTAINPNGVGYAITRNAFVQLVSVFTNWSRVGIWAHEGGQVTMANSNNTFGDYSFAATDLRYSVLIPDPTSNIGEYDAAATIIDNNFDDIVTDVMGRYQTLPGWDVAYDELAERDTRTLLRALANDLRSGQSRATQYFIKGLFNWNAAFAFNASLVPLFILSWQEVEVELYDRIVDIPARNMITELVDLAQAVAQDIYTRQVAGTTLLDSPYVTAYASVVEATGQQFSYAGSGVNYNSLPFSQRGTGIAPDPSSTIVKHNGGRVYATFSTEVGDTYLGEDLRVDFERSTVEGQAFSRGVQNIALPLTVALGG
jgi:hypothetical protein